MVQVGAGAYALGAERVSVGSFRLDRREVANAEFQAFVDDGGYSGPEAWTTSLASRGVVVDDERARAEFRDATGQPGPATWELSRYPEGRADHPVRGVSWYEAVAFCAYAGKSLPTFYHSKVAAGIDVWDGVIIASNFGSRGGRCRWAAPVPWEAREPSTWRATFESGSGTARPTTATSLAGPGISRVICTPATKPWSHGPAGRTTASAALSTTKSRRRSCSIRLRSRSFDFTDFEPVDDATFAIYRSFYDYDPMPPDVSSEVVETTEDWIRERVEFDAAYSNERVVAHVFLPRSAQPPYQTVVYVPGSAAFMNRSSERISEMEQLMFLLRSGRALIYPVIKGAYERRVDGPQTPTIRRQTIVAQTQDVMRSVDYALERDDLDGSALAYMGVSYGAELAVPVAMEKRFAAAVLVGAALDPAWRGSVPEEAAPWNFASRITTPTILINGRQDVMHPYEEGQIPFFEAIDLPANDKEFFVSDAGHLPPWNEVIRYTFGWLDQRLGPVATSNER